MLSISLFFYFFCNRSNMITRVYSFPGMHTENIQRKVRKTQEGRSRSL